MSSMILRGGQVVDETVGLINYNLKKIVNELSNCFNTIPTHFSFKY